MSRPWMPLYVADYLGDTRRLNTLQHGAYMLLIMEYWQNGGLPNDDDELAQITGLPVEQWQSVRPKIEALFQPGWRHKRIDAELSRADEKSSKAKESAGKRWQSKGNANAMPTQCEGISERNAKADANAMLPQPQPQEKTYTDAGVREAEREFRLQLVDVYRETGCQQTPDGGHVAIWLARGHKPEICLAVVREGLRAKGRFLPPKYFDQQIADAHVAPVGRRQEARAGPNTPREKPTSIAAQILQRDRERQAYERTDAPNQSLVIDATALAIGSR